MGIHNFLILVASQGYILQKKSHFKIYLVFKMNSALKTDK